VEAARNVTSRNWQEERGETKEKKKEKEKKKLTFPLQQKNNRGGGKNRSRNNGKKGLATDREISNAKASQRELQKWEDDSGLPENEGLETGGPKKEWDQFEANKKFGYKSTFDMNLYTTSVNLFPFFFFFFFFFFVLY
jgi:PAB1-binding protein PBP1